MGFSALCIKCVYLRPGMPVSLLALVRIIYKYHHSLLKFKRNIYKKTEAIFCFRERVEKAMVN